MPMGIDPKILVAWRGLLSCWDAWALTLVLAVLVPTLAYRRFRQLAPSGDRAVSSRRKLATYGKIVGRQWLLVAAMLLILWRHGFSATEAGERLADRHLTFGVTLALLAVLAVVSMIVLRRVRRAKPDTLNAAVGRLQRLAPSSRLEMAAFVAVCLTAGFCEEMLYRGWLVTILLAATGSPWTAVVASAIAFGVGHASQGIMAILRAAFVGLQLGILYVMVGSLIPGQVLHTGVDLLVGVAGALAASKLSAAKSSANAGL
jgi:membrane protease YdiL (CAAX protease family)